MLSVALTTLGKLAQTPVTKTPSVSPSTRNSRSLTSSLTRSSRLSSRFTQLTLRSSLERPRWTRNYSNVNSEPSEPQPKEKAPSYASYTAKPKPVPKSERVQWSPPVEPKRDPWRITTGTWYSPALKKIAVAQQIIERDFHLPEPTNSTPPSLPYPSSEAEERLLTEMLLKVDSTLPSNFVSEILPYFDSLSYYKQLSSGSKTLPPVSPEKLTLHLASSFSVLQALPAPSTDASSSALTPLWLVLSAMDIFIGIPEVIKKIAENEKLADTHGETAHAPRYPSQSHKQATLSNSSHTNNTDLSASDDTTNYLTPDQARILSETSEDHLKLILPALVEADVYYAAEVMNGVLKKKLRSSKLGKFASEISDASDATLLGDGSTNTEESKPFAFLSSATSSETSPILEISEILRSTLNPRQLTGLLPAMCRTNAEWREDGFFDLMVDVMSTGGILRWEPEDVASVISALPKVPIAADYFTPSEIDPLNAANADKSSDELLKIAQKMAPTRWDSGAYGLPGDFFLRPSKEDVEAAKREFEEEMMEEESTTTSAPLASNVASSAEHTTAEDGMATSSASSAERSAKSSSFTAPEEMAEDDLLSYLDVTSESKVVEEVVESGNAVGSPPAFYNPIAWQPEEIGRLVGTMLSQELELDDIVHVLCTMATDRWEEEAGQAPWSAYMGYISSVVSEALTTNKHWIDEDYSWVLHDVIATVGPWALRKWPDYGVEEHQKWLAELVSQIAIKYGRFKHDYRFIQIALNMICDNWPEHEHQKLADVIALRMKDRTFVGRTKHWVKWRISQEYQHKFSDQRAASSHLWVAPYNVGNNPKMPTFVKSAGLRDPGLVEKIQRAITETEDQKLSAPSRTGSKPQNEIMW